MARPRARLTPSLSRVTTLGRSETPKVHFQVPGNHFTYNAVLNACAKALQWPQSLWLLREMPQRRVRPDLISPWGRVEVFEAR